MLNNALWNAIALVALTIPMTGMLPKTALAAQQDFRFYNQTGRVMVGLWVADSDEEVGGDDILNRTLPNGYNTAVFVPCESSSCLFDLSAQFSDGSTAEDYQINLCTVVNYTFYP